jgi:hypothetical protein
MTTANPYYNHQTPYGQAPYGYNPVYPTYNYPSSYQNQYPQHTYAQYHKPPVYPVQPQYPQPVYTPINIHYPLGQHIPTSQNVSRSHINTTSQFRYHNLPISKHTSSPTADLERVSEKFSLLLDDARAPHSAEPSKIQPDIRLITAEDQNHSSSSSFNQDTPPCLDTHTHSSPTIHTNSTTGSANATKNPHIVKGRGVSGHKRTGSEDIRACCPNNNKIKPGHKRNASDGVTSRMSFQISQLLRPNHQRTGSNSYNNNNNSNSSNLAAVVPEYQECSVCLTEVPNNDFYDLSCGHSFCVGCTKQHFDVLISSGVTRIICLQVGCGKEVTGEELASLVDPSFIDKLIRYEKKKLLAGKKTTRYCPAVNCGEPVVPDSTNSKKLTCDCGKIFCFDCGEDWHEDMTCKEAEKRLGKSKKLTLTERRAARWKKKHTKPCPRCGISIQKTAGCEFMQCGSCDFQFCWKCLEPHDHFMTTHKHGSHGRKGRIAKKVALGTAVGLGIAVLAVPALLVGGVAIPALIIGGSIIASSRNR